MIITKELLAYLKVCDEAYASFSTECPAGIEREAGMIWVKNKNNPLWTDWAYNYLFSADAALFTNQATRLNEYRFYNSIIRSFQMFNTYEECNTNRGVFINSIPANYTVKQLVEIEDGSVALSNVANSQDALYIVFENQTGLHTHYRTTEELVAAVSGIEEKSKITNLLLHPIQRNITDSETGINYWTSNDLAFV